jgi:purine-binding chemotaxis protein CheW
MDLVEIRKKAGKKRTPPAEADTPVVPVDVAPAAPPPRPTRPATPPAPVAAEPEVLPPVAVKMKPSAPRKTLPVEIDPIEALFSFRGAGELATEEIYLQALMGKQEESDAQKRQWLTFTLGDEEYALDIESITEIIKPREVTDIPRVPEFIRGIISLRGIIVPIFDLKGRLKLGRVEMGATARIIVCQTGDRIAGFLVDSINQVVNIPLSKIEPPPTVLSGVDRDFVEGVGRIDGRMLILLHLSHVMNAELVN